MRKIAYLGVLLLAIFSFAGCHSDDENGVMRISDFFLCQNKQELEQSESWVAPDFSGWSCAEVTKRLNEINQEYEIIYISDEKENVNVITFHQPNYGQSISKNEKLKLYVNDYYAKSPSIRLLYSYILPIAEMGEWLYFTDEKNIMRSRDDFKNCELIYTHKLESEYIKSILPRDAQIFFLTKDGQNELCLYTIEIGGFQSQKISSMRLCRDFFATGDELHILNSEVWNYNISKQELTKKDYQYRIFSYLKNSNCLIYFESQGDHGPYALIKKNIDDGSETILVESDRMVMNACLYKDSIYYIGLEENNGFSFNEYLHRFDLSSMQDNQLQKMSSSPFTTNYLCVWHDDLVLVRDDRVIKVDISDNTYENHTIMIEWDDILYSILCGNYIYQFSPYEDGVTLANRRYNLVTDEFEDFEWQ